MFLDLFEKGKKVNVGESVGEIESVKIAASVYAPITGEIVDVSIIIIFQLIFSKFFIFIL